MCVSRCVVVGSAATSSSCPNVLSFFFLIQELCISFFSLPLFPCFLVFFFLFLISYFLFLGDAGCLSLGFMHWLVFLHKRRCFWNRSNLCCHMVPVLRPDWYAPSRTYVPAHTNLVPPGCKFLKSEMHLLANQSGVSSFVTWPLIKPK